MGHRHTSEEFHGERAVCGSDGRFVAAAEERGAGAMSENFFAKPKEKIAAVVTEQTDTKARTQSVAVRCALLAIRFYKAYLSILFAGSCRFEPTCSRFAYEAIERFGVARGCWLGFKRLLRCQPLSRKFGYDPVPEKWEDMSSKSMDAAHPEVHS
jgi:uncharacterized protein